MKCKCKNTIPKARVALGYTTCVECSTVERYGCIDTINHKTGNSIQVMSRSDADKAAADAIGSYDPEDAEPE